MALEGGVLYIESESILNTNYVNFIKNEAYLASGVIFISTNS